LVKAVLDVFSTPHVPAGCALLYAAAALAQDLWQRLPTRSASVVTA